jgi:hypothetical protein
VLSGELPGGLSLWIVPAHVVPGDRENCACFGVNLKALCIFPLLVTRPRHGSRGLGLLLGRRERHIGVGSGFVTGQLAGDPRAAAE